MKAFNRLPVLAIAATLMAAGCASTGYKKAERSSISIQKAAQEIDKSTFQMDVVLASLSDLLNNPGPDLRPQFKTFESGLRDLEALAKDVSGQADDMQNAGAAYFENWDMDLARIQNEEIRARSAERRNEVARRFERLRSNYELTRSAFNPFMSDLEDIRTALQADLTVDGLNSIKSVADQANQHARPLREALSKLAADFKEMGVSLSPRISDK